MMYMEVLLIVLSRSLWQYKPTHESIHFISASHNKHTCSILILAVKT